MRRKGDYLDLHSTPLHFPLLNPIPALLLWSAELFYFYSVFPDPPDFVSLANVTSASLLPMLTC